MNNWNGVRIAEGNVRHKTGGPVMTLVGFMHSLTYEMFQVLSENLTEDQQRFLAEKIIVDKEKGVGFYPKAFDTIFYGHIFNRNGELLEWWFPDTYARSFKCLTRFYDERSNLFVYKVFHPTELELITE